jgi:hypothetical protein
MTNPLSNGAADARRQFVNRHFDKIVVARLILICFLFQFLMLWLASDVPDNQWMRSIVSRAADLVGNIALALTGALTTLITGKNLLSQRANDVTNSTTVPPTQGGNK